MSSKSARVTSGFSVDDDVEVPPPPRRVRTRSEIMNGEGRAPARVPLAELAHNPYNPREELVDLDETVASLRERGQLVALTVVTRAAFEAAHPDRSDTVDPARWVVLDGNRRLAAAHLAGLDELRIDVNDALAASAADILENALVANLHRAEVPPLDEAKAIRDLLKIHGSQEKVARRLSKSGAWVSQRLALLQLPQDLQHKVESGELKVKDGRRIGRLPAQQQHTEAAKALNPVKATRPQPQPAKPRPHTPAVRQVEAPSSKDTPLSPTPGDDTRLAEALDEVLGITRDPDTLAEVLVDRLPRDMVVALTNSLMAHI
jgi:ParB family transcriptional regulator, chromosome partitioning protein